MYYLKLWHDARNDAKLRALTDPQFRVWFNLLLFASEQAIRGNIEFESEELLAIEVANGDVDLLNETVKRLETLRCVSSRFIGISGGSGLRRISFMSFEKRQECNGLVSTPRVQKHRANKKLRAGETHETPVKHMKRVSETKETTELELELELEKESPPREKSPPGGVNSLSRSGEDLSLLNEAIQLLASDLRTNHLAPELGRQHNTAVNVHVPGWKWLRAAKAILGPSYTDGHRQRFAYFAGIAAKITEADLVERPEAKRETKAERKAREMKESMGRRMAMIEAERAKGTEAANGG